MSNERLLLKSAWEHFELFNFKRLKIQRIFLSFKEKSEKKGTEPVEAAVAGSKMLVINSIHKGYM